MTYALSIVKESTKPVFTPQERQRLKHLNDNGSIKLYGFLRREAFKNKENVNTPWLLENFAQNFENEEDIRLCERYSKNYYNRNIRLKKKIEKIITDFQEPVFLTLTFSDASLETTSKETRRQYVRKYLKKQCSYYIANIDYGKENGREHYHAVVCSPVNPLEWRHGALNCKRIVNKNSRALAKYINKLTNHALKDTALKGYQIIYSVGLGVKGGSGRLRENDKDFILNELKSIFNT